MSSSLRRQLREALPASIKGLQRAIALEIADDARYDDGWKYDPEHGRRSRVRLADLVRWTGAKDELTVREMLRRLSVAGWEFRLPIGKDKHGNVLYAVSGRATTFRVPDFAPPTVVGGDGLEGPTTVGGEPSDDAAPPTVVDEGPTTVVAPPTTVGAAPTSVGPPSPVPPSSRKDSPSSSVAEVSPTDQVVESEDGGGGGDLSSRAIATEIAAELDYRGKPPGKAQRQQIEDLLAAALEADWSMDGLAVVLDITGQDVRYAPGVYIKRLEELPDAESAPSQVPSFGGARGPMPTAEDYTNVTVNSLFGFDEADPAGDTRWEQATARARQRMAGAGGRLDGTDDRVAGWADLSRQFAKHTPYSNDSWTAPADPATTTTAHCGDWDCDPRTRMRDHDIGNGLKNCTQCTKCHPSMQF